MEMPSAWPDLDVSRRDSAAILRVQLTEINENNFRDVEEECVQAAASTGASHILLDLSAVGFLSSSGISFVLRLLKWTRQQDGRLVLCGLQPLLLELFQPLPTKQRMQENWQGPFFAGSVDEGLALVSKSPTAKEGT
jgi:anti-anti-sigma factor